MPQIIDKFIFYPIITIINYTIIYKTNELAQINF